MHGFLFGKLKMLMLLMRDFRRGEGGVFNGNECIFMAPPAQFVSQLMDDLFTYLYNRYIKKCKCT